MSDQSENKDEFHDLRFTAFHEKSGTEIFVSGTVNRYTFTGTLVKQQVSDSKRELTQNCLTRLAITRTLSDEPMFLWDRRLLIAPVDQHTNKVVDLLVTVLQNEAKRAFEQHELHKESESRLANLFTKLKGMRLPRIGHDR